MFPLRYIINRTEKNLLLQCSYVNGHCLYLCVSLFVLIKLQLNDFSLENLRTAILICRKHVWANFCLAHHNEKLLNDNSALQDYGVRNNSQVCHEPYRCSAMCHFEAGFLHEQYMDMNSVSLHLMFPYSCFHITVMGKQSFHLQTKI